MRSLRRYVAPALILLLIGSGRLAAESRTIARCGDGFIETIDGYRVLHVEGTPYEMGYQHGTLLKNEIRELVRFLFDVKAKEIGEELKLQLAGLELKPDARAIIRTIAKIQRKYVPDRFYKEMQGLADGCGLPLDDVVCANFIPELFHCSGFALAGSATRNGNIYHGRILDYGTDWRLQDAAVLVVAKPEGRIPFANVTYAGFIGSVTGINAERISLGEMGGRGLGHWQGVPMALLMRIALEEAHSLDEAVAIFRDSPRTCEYYYVIADGETRRAVGMEASWNTFTTAGLGESHPKLPDAVSDCVLLSAGDRYTELVRRARAGHGQFDADSARALMDRPVAMKSNLHSVLFETDTTRLWIANASKDGLPASTQHYFAFQLSELLTRQPAAPAENDSSIGAPASAQPVRIDLATPEGLARTKAQWRWHDVKLVAAENRSDGQTFATYDYEPKATGPDFDDSGWEVIDPKTLGQRRSAGKICFCWYRIKVTLPEEVAGKKVTFVTTVDDYGEIWVDGKLPYKVGQSGGAIVAGFNAPNRVELLDPQPGKTYQIAIFGINGPISVVPTNRIFLRDAFLEIEAP
jgi:hypothetical protein